MTDNQLLAREAKREYDRQRRFNSHGKGRRFVYIDALEKDENGENDLDKLGFFSDHGKGALAIRSFDENEFESRLRSAFRKIDSLEQEIVKKVIQNGHENRERTIRWIMKNQLNRRYRQRRRFKGNATLREFGISKKCGKSKKS